MASLTSKSVPAHAVTYWNLFNSEGDSTGSAQFVTYTTLNDMLGDTNGVPGPFPTHVNIVGSGSTLFEVRDAIPEPITATLGLMGLGVIGLATRRRAA